jgi:hypothetical protein
VRLKVSPSRSEFQNFLNEQLQDEEFREQWNNIKPEMDAIRASNDICVSQNLNPPNLKSL